MSVPFHSQLQPFEENQSPSPTHEIENPYELALHRSRSPPGKPNGPPSPVNTVNSLQRQFSGDPENPPPAWQRRPSVSTQRSGKSSIRSNSHSATRGNRSPSDASSIPPISSASTRRHPNLTMTATRQAAGLPNTYFMHESPSGSSTSLNDDPTLTLPRPAFGRKGPGSNRSSIVSSGDLSSLTSEELWSMDQEQLADMSNPLTRASERPLDTVRRMSTRIEHSPYRAGLPQDMIWPSAPPPEDSYDPPITSRSVTSMASLRSGNKKRTTKRQSRQASLDIPHGVPTKNIDQVYAKSTPVSPQDAVLISSNNSSSTSLASHVMKNKSGVSLNGNRPPSVYYSRDFLSTLAPREGGYAIAATMGNGLGAVGTMSVEERRRSSVYDNERPRSNARAPMSKSSGMGRWSLDGGEHYGRPFATPSANTTTSNLSARATSNSDHSPPADDDASRTSYLPDGAATPAATSRSTSIDQPAPPPLPVTSAPMNPSPLGRDTAAEDVPSPGLEGPGASIDAAAAALPVAPGPVAAPVPVPSPSTVTTPAAQPSPLNTKKSKKDLAKESKLAAKEAKAAEKAAAAKVQQQRVEAAKASLAKKEADKQAAKKKKEDDKRQAKLDKARLKAEKKAGSKSMFKSSSTVALAKSTSTPSSGTTANSSIPPVPPLPQQDARSGVPFPRAQSANKVPLASGDQPRKTAVSMPLGSMAGSTTRPAGPVQSTSTRSKIGMLGTIKKRLSVFGDLKTDTATHDLPPVPPTPKQLNRTASPSTSAPIGTAVSTDQGVELSRMVTPPQMVVSSAEVTPEPLSQLPPRSSSHTPREQSVGSQFTSPQSYHSAQMATPTPPVAHPVSGSPQQVQNSPLTKSVSNDQGHRTGSPSSSVLRGSSVRGPRPMPRGPHSPEHPHVERLSASIDPPALAPEIATPTTFGDSEGNGSMFSQAASKESQGTDLASPYTSESVGDHIDRAKRQEVTPEREGSNDTVHAVGYAHPQTVSAH